jgi:hypothetical protein
MNRLPNNALGLLPVQFVVVMNGENVWSKSSKTFVSPSSVADPMDPCLFLVFTNGIGTVDMNDLTGMPKGVYYLAYRETDAQANAHFQTSRLCALDDEWHWDGTVGQTLDEIIEESVLAAFSGEGGGGPGSGGTPPPSSGNADTVNAYLYTRDSTGTIAPGMTVNYRLLAVGAAYTGGAWTDDIQSGTSNGSGLFSVNFARDAYYTYWIGSGRPKTVHVTDDTLDPYALPTVTG